jgi:hypothetical protein
MTAIRTLLATCLILAAALDTTGCGRNARKTVGTTLSGTQASGLQGTFVVTRADKRWVIGQLHLTNTGPDIIAFANYGGPTISGFRMTAGNAPSISAEGGIFAKSGASRLDAIAPGQIVDMEIKWRLVVEPTTPDYPITVTITNLRTGNAAAPDLTLR